MKILIIDNDKICASLIKGNLQKYLLFAECSIVSTFDELKQCEEECDLYLVNNILPDTKRDEHIEYLIEQNKKIILMSKFEDKSFKEKWNDKVVDIIFKDDNVIFHYLVKIVKRLYKNNFLNVLIVDDSNFVLEYISKMLKLLNFNIFKAKDGYDALEILNEKEINLIITDIEMPRVNGLEFVREIRKFKNVDELPILVLSSTTNMNNVFKILKLGANDFIKKPFEKEEFIIRINNLLEIYDYLYKYKKSSLIDALTGAYNRFYLENELEKLCKIYHQKTLAMLDIDFFKKINDTYGHQKGDEVLKYFSNLIKNNIRKNDVLIRYGGEEFLIFMPNTTKEEGYLILTKIKKILEDDGDKPIDFTFSAGIADEFNLLSELIKKADERLYKAKKSGRNKIVIR